MISARWRCGWPKVRACETIKESKKLLHLTVFDGERERCILSGIAKWYKPEDLVGKKVGIVANLAPRPMLKGKYTSEGMIVAADTADGGCAIAFYPDSTAPGSPHPLKEAALAHGHQRPRRQAGRPVRRAGLRSGLCRPLQLLLGVGFPLHQAGLPALCH